MPYSVAAVLYAALMSVAWIIGTEQAREKTDAQLDYAILDFRSTIGGAIDTMLGHATEAAVRHFKTPGRHSMEEMAAVAKHLDLDELNIIDRDGMIIASNDPSCIGVDMKKTPETREFMKLTDGKTPTVAQPFRQHAYDAKARRKYLGKPFPGGNGYIQVGLDEQRLAKMLPEILGYIFDEWLLGRTGFFLCADAETDAMISNPSRHRNEASTLSEAGFSAKEAKPYEITGGEGAGETFVQTLFGEKCYCRCLVFGGHRFVPALPEHEYYDTRNVYVSVFGVLLAALLGSFAWFLDRIARDSDRLKAFFAAQEASRAKEMEIAKTIQNAALPAPLPPNPAFRLSAEMRAAKEVGGDFYDFFEPSPGKLAFLVADVSGKGISAALYMMTAKATIKNALMSGLSPAAALSKANAELSRGNTANMFLTAWAGIMDMESGKVAFANAGHNPPVLMHAAEGRGPEYLMAKSGPMMAYLDSVDYKPLSLTLKPGDALFLYTDGVTEALDGKDELFGEERLSETLGTVASNAPDAICRHVRVAVAAFAAGAPQADDITVLAIERLEPPHSFSRSFPPAQSGIADASAYLDGCLAALPQDDAEMFAPAMPALHVILDEIASNIVKHSGASGFQVDVTFNHAAGTAKLLFVDDGKPYDPLTHEDPDTTLSAEERPIGGLGLLMVKKMSDSLSYKREHNRNVFWAEKAMPAPAKKDA